MTCTHLSPAGGHPEWPLFILTYASLWDLGTTEALDVVETKQHAFHEAGHAWAAHSAGLALLPRNLSGSARPYTASGDWSTARLAAFGPLVQGLSIELDEVSEDALALLTAEDLDTYNIWEHTTQMRRASCCCRRGGDHPAERLLEDETWIGNELAELLRDWRPIAALAHRIMTSDVVDDATTSAQRLQT